MDHFISMYIDDELSLDEKILFVENIYGHLEYKNDTLSLLEQEKILASTLNQQAPENTLPVANSPKKLAPLGLALAASLLLVLSFIAGSFLYPLQQPGPPTAMQDSTTFPHRFVLLRQDTERVEITGSFTNWQKVPLSPTGSAGYWEITLEIPAGEHRYSFIIDGEQLLPDPTVATSEPDDFGTINSILQVES